MKNHLSIALLFAISLICTHSAVAAYHLEVTDVPGVNMLRINLWADGSELTTPVQVANAQLGFSNFTGNISPTDITFQSVDGLGVFSGQGPLVGSPFNQPLSFTAFYFPTIMLPSSANDAADALPILEVSYSSTGTGTFDAEVLAPDPLDFASTVVDGNHAGTTGSTAGAVNISAVPEPSSFILVGLMGGLGYGCVWLRRRRANAA